MSGHELSVQPSYGIDAEVRDDFTIEISQADPMGDEGNVVILTFDEARKLKDWLEDVITAE